MSETPRDTSEEDGRNKNIIYLKEFVGFPDEKIESTREKVKRTLNPETEHFSEKERPPETELHYHRDCTINLISLIGPYKSEVAKDTFDRVVNRNSHPGHFILQPLQDIRKEIEHAESIARMTKIPCSNLIISPYNPSIARAAGVRLKDALIAIILADVSRYSTDPDGVENVVAKNFKATSKDMDAIREEIFGDFEKCKSEAVSSFNKLLQTSNDVSWHLVKLAGLKGRIMAMVGAEHARIFTRVFRPSREYSLEKLHKIMKEVERTNPTEAIIVRGDFPEASEEGALREHLRVFPHDELARRKLENMKKKGSGR